MYLEIKRNNKTYTLEVEYTPRLSFEPNLANSRDDLLDDLEVVCIMDEAGNDVTDSCTITNEQIIREIELNREAEGDMIWTRDELTMKHIADDSDWYAEEMYNV